MHAKYKIRTITVCLHKYKKNSICRVKLAGLEEGLDAAYVPSEHRDPKYALEYVNSCV